MQQNHLPQNCSLSWRGAHPFRRRPGATHSTPRPAVTATYTLSKNALRA